MQHETWNSLFFSMDTALNSILREYATNTLELLKQPTYNGSTLKLLCQPLLHWDRYEMDVALKQSLLNGCMVFNENTV